MRFFLILSILFSSVISLSQSEFAKNKILLVKENLEKVPPYTCEVKIKIDVSFINIKERIGKDDFLGPNDIDYKLKGFAFWPKRNGVYHLIFSTQILLQFQLAMKMEMKLLRSSQWILMLILSLDSFG